MPRNKQPSDSLWQRCLQRLEGELSPELVSTWLRPLHAHEHDGVLRLLAPNRYVLDEVRRAHLGHIQRHAAGLEPALRVELDVGSAPSDVPTAGMSDALTDEAEVTPVRRNGSAGNSTVLNGSLRFDNFIEGASNRLARAAAMMVADQCGGQYNPLLIYGGVGLGKTHLLHALGNAVLAADPNRRVVYKAAERFVNEMVGALAAGGRDNGRFGSFERFRSAYRDADVLMMDDIQFLAGKDRSQEEFVHIFNALLDGRRQVVMTCDRYPKDIRGLEDRLKSRFGWGLTVAVEPPDLETRVAIVLSKAREAGQPIPEDVAFLIGRRIHSNVRELEGALRLVLAFANFARAPVSLDLAREALKDILRAQDRMITVDTIQKAVAEHYRIRTADLVSASRRRSVTRPRQVAMALAKELTRASLPEIGAAFGGRDHTTVLHACGRVSELRQTDTAVEEDYRLLLRTLTA